MLSNRTLATSILAISLFLVLPQSGFAFTFPQIKMPEISVPQISVTTTQTTTSSSNTNVQIISNGEGTTEVTTQTTQLSTNTPTPTSVIQKQTISSPTPTPWWYRLLNPTATKTPTPTPTKSVTPTPTTKPSTTPMPTSVSSTNSLLDSKQQYMVNAINAYRKQNGLSPVQPDKYTCSFANTRAKEIVTNFSHDGFSQRLNSKTLPYPGYSLITENITMTSNYQNVVNMWIVSPGHALNMRKDTPYVCVAYSGNYYAYEGWRP